MKSSCMPSRGGWWCRPYTLGGADGPLRPHGCGRDTTTLFSTSPQRRRSIERSGNGDSCTDHRARAGLPRPSRPYPRQRDQEDASLPGRVAGRVERSPSHGDHCPDDDRWTRVPLASEVPLSTTVWIRCARPAPHNRRRPSPEGPGITRCRDSARRPRPAAGDVRRVGSIGLRRRLSIRRMSRSCESAHATLRMSQGRKSRPIMPDCSMELAQVRRCSRDFAVRGSSCALAPSSPRR